MNYNKYGLFYEKSAKKQAKINIEIDMQHAWGACGRKFESCRPDLIIKELCIRMAPFFISPSPYKYLFVTSTFHKLEFLHLSDTPLSYCFKSLTYRLNVRAGIQKI